MKFSFKRLFPCAAVCAFLMTACSGSKKTTAEITEEPTEVSIPDAPDAAIEMIAKQLADGNAGILWKAMPASYQVDLNGIAHLASNKVDPEIYNKSFSLIGRLADVADRQKSFILNTELGGKKPEEQIAQLEAAWPSIIGFVKTISGSPIASVEGLQAFEGQQFFDSTVSSLIEYTADLTSLSEEGNPLQFGTVKLLVSTDDTALLEMTAPDGSIESEAFTKVESRWVPAEMATDWGISMARAKAKLESISPEQIAQSKPQLLSILAMVEGILTQIEVAETQEQFDQALQGAMMPLMGLMMMQQGMGGSHSAPAMPSVAPALPADLSAP
jgi:hypothetical protein